MLLRLRFPLMILSLVVLVGCGGGEDKPSTPSEPATPSEPDSSGTPDTPSPTKSTPAAEDIAEGWGHLKGRFTYGGEAPAPTPVTVTTDKEYCGKHEINDESVVVNPKNKGLANVVVFLHLKRDAEPPQAHESYASADGTVTLDNNLCQFVPHVCVLQTSQKLLVKNSDTVGHNTNIAPENNPSFNQTIPVGDSVEVEFNSAERRPAPVNCNIHPWMKGWLLPQQTPYFAVTNKDGEFEIKNLPSGVWTFQVWHETMGGVDNVSVDGKTTKWSKGRLELAIRPDEATDLGEVTIAADEFK